MQPSRAVPGGRRLATLAVLAAASVGAVVPVAPAAAQAASAAGATPSATAGFSDAAVKASPALAASAASAGGATLRHALLTRGARVRLRVPMMGKEKVAGRVLVAQGDSVVLDTVDAAAERRMFFPNTITVEAYRRVTLPLSAVDSVEVSAGRSRRAGVLRSAARGALYLGLLGAATFRSGDGAPNLRNAIGGSVNGALFGFALGGAVGATRGGERWESVR